MAMPFSHEDLDKLKNFVEFVSKNPTILNYPQLEFVKNFIEKFGGKIPSGEFKMPAGGGCPFSGAAKPADKKPEEKLSTSDEEEGDTEPESEIELDMEGVIEGDTDPKQEMGDESKIPTEDEIEKASELRSEAAGAYSEQKYEEAISLYTKAIEMNPGNALFHAKRGQAFLKLQKPNACIRDCDKALELNCDSAAAYKFRGRAHRMLGNWEDAAKDLRQACKIDFDEEADEWLREVTPNAKKIEQHRIKQERKQAEQRIRRAQAANRKARKAQEEQQKQQEQNDGPEADGFPGSFPGSFPSGGFMGDIMGALKDPEIAAALQDIAANPANIDKYKHIPRIAAVINLVKNMSGSGNSAGGGFPGFPGGFPGNNASANPPPPSTDETTTTKNKDDNKKKPSFVDDGLD